MCIKQMILTLAEQCFRDMRRREVWSQMIIVLVAMPSNYFRSSGRISVRKTCDSPRDRLEVSIIMISNMWSTWFLASSLMEISYEISPLNGHSDNFAWPRAIGTNCAQSKIQMCPDYALIRSSCIPQSGKAMSCNFRTVVFSPWLVSHEMDLCPKS